MRLFINRHWKQDLQKQHIALYRKDELNIRILVKYGKNKVFLNCAVGYFLFLKLCFEVLEYFENLTL